jgi:uncharacterized membrane protein YfcA
MEGFALVVALAAFLGGGVAALSGFGIGSVLTPALSLQLDTKLAVAVVAIPHVMASALRLWIHRRHVNRRVLISFGLASAAGGFLGAFAFQSVRAPFLSILFGGLLLFVAISQLTGLADRMRFSGPVAFVAGVLSGFLGGLVGNQGGIRTAGLFGTDLTKDQFIATSTAVAVIVDGARLPVYLATEHFRLLAVWPLVVVSCAGAIAGTLVGHRILRRLPPESYRVTVACLLAILGVAMIAHGLIA